MPLTTTREMLIKAQQDSYAVGAFNIENMEMAQAVIEAAEECRAPVILQTTPSTLKYGTPGLYAAMVGELAKKTSVPVALHLDHGSSYALAAEACKAGYTSIMIDGSRLPLEENISLTKSVSHMCGSIPVEGELGRVGGKEDDLECEDGGYTDPDEAVRFQAESGLFSMAVGVGTAHGVYKTVPVLNTALISRLKDRLSCPMVLHGASGLTDSAIKECIREGICKVNFATELREAYTAAVRRELSKDIFDPKIYGKAARQSVKALVMSRMAVCGCNNRYE